MGAAGAKLVGSRLLHRMRRLHGGPATSRASPAVPGSAEPSVPPPDPVP